MKTVQIHQRKSTSYVMTLANTPKGREVLKKVRAEHKAKGQQLRVYGRGSFKRACLAEIAAEPNCRYAVFMRQNPNGVAPWNWAFFRPKLKYAEKLDVYIR